MNIQEIRFNKNDRPDFVRILRKRVNDYFVENNISRHGNWKMVLKTILLVSALLIPYTLILINAFSSPWLVLLLWLMIAVASAGIGFSVMHDANHGAYSSIPWVNKIVGKVMTIVGGSEINWKIQHNVLHHSFTNVDGMDEDIDAGILLRFSPNQEKRWFHRFQHIYAWVLYSMMTWMWITTKDFKQVFRYFRNGLLKQEGLTLGTALTRVILSKIIYYAYLLVLPLIFSNQPWWLTLLFFGIMHHALGLITAVVFQLAHVIPDTNFPQPDAEGNLENSWAIHQLLTTANFAPKNKIISWFVGGLNYQIEHHLFPNICHIHYSRIAKIVEKTAQEYGLPYVSYPSFRSALKVHAKMLWMLGTQPQLNY